jgi:hypothetical protein
MTRVAGGAFDPGAPGLPDPPDRCYVLAGRTPLEFTLQRASRGD